MLIMNENSEANDENLSTARSITSPNFVLPPIISSERDREFLISLNASIDEELTKVKDRYHPEQRFMVYKSAFDQVSLFLSFVVHTCITFCVYLAVKQ